MICNVCADNFNLRSLAVYFAHTSIKKLIKDEHLLTAAASQDRVQCHPRAALSQTSKFFLDDCQCTNIHTHTWCYADAEKIHLANNNNHLWQTLLKSKSEKAVAVVYRQQQMLALEKHFRLFALQRDERETQNWHLCHKDVAILMILHVPKTLLSWQQFVSCGASSSSSERHK